MAVSIRDARTGTPACAIYTSTADDRPGTKVADLDCDGSTAGGKDYQTRSEILNFRFRGFTAVGTV
ncbi:hypothetical protein [Candidatus Palauibacter sp.]|uniref:hypothetical protein n=1 Tax=Candidatus Palauibacter sp. TaxID=3101350 RepID=UPI003B515BE0